MIPLFDANTPESFKRTYESFMAILNLKIFGSEEDNTIFRFILNMNSLAFGPASDDDAWNNPMLAETMKVLSNKGLVQYILS